MIIKREPWLFLSEQQCTVRKWNVIEVTETNEYSEVKLGAYMLGKISIKRDITNITSKSVAQGL